jgi:hypothetical protein
MAALQVGSKRLPGTTPVCHARRRSGSGHENTILEALGDANALGDSREPLVGQTSDSHSVKIPNESFGRTVR